MLAHHAVPHAAGSTPGGSRPTWLAAGRAPPSSIQWWTGTLCATPSCTTRLCASGTASRAAMAPSAALGVAPPSRAAAVGAPGSRKNFSPSQTTAVVLLGASHSGTWWHAVPHKRLAGRSFCLKSTDFVACCAQHLVRLFESNLFLGYLYDEILMMEDCTVQAKPLISSS